MASNDQTTLTQRHADLSLRLNRLIHEIDRLGHDYADLAAGVEGSAVDVGKPPVDLASLAISLVQAADTLTAAVMRSQREDGRRVHTGPIIVDSFREDAS